MERKLFFILMLLVIIPSVVAETSLTIKTCSGCDITVYVVDPSLLNTIRTLNGTADSSGIFSASFSTGLLRVDLSVISRYHGTIVNKDNMKFEDYLTSESISIDLTSQEASLNTSDSETEAVNNTPVQQEETIIENTSASEEGVTGAAVSENEGNSLLSRIPKFVYYIVGGILIALVVVIILMKVPFSSFSLPRAPASYKVRKYPEITSIDEKKLSDAEKKIKEAQEEINRIKNKKHEIDDAEKRFEEAKKNLERLKGGKI